MSSNIALHCDERYRCILAYRWCKYKLR